MEESVTSVFLSDEEHMPTARSANEIHDLQAFDQCDVDGSGRIDIKELHIGLLILYDKINRLLPIHYPLPSKREVNAHWSFEAT